MSDQCGSEVTRWHGAARCEAPGFAACECTRNLACIWCRQTCPSRCQRPALLCPPVRQDAHARYAFAQRRYDQGLWYTESQGAEDAPAAREQGVASIFAGTLLGSSQEQLSPFAPRKGALSRSERRHSESDSCAGPWQPGAQRCNPLRFVLCHASTDGNDGHLIPSGRVWRPVLLTPHRTSDRAPGFQRFFSTRSVRDVDRKSIRRGRQTQVQQR